ncbi:MAG TPA: SDR family NAD(P)-dependent oxidoreductase [Motiliproteus sp.]
MPDQKRVVITGATGAIGSALAQHYAQPNTCLLLQGRSQEQLQRVAERCRQQGADVLIYSFDLTDQQALLDWCTTLCCDHVPDILIANAGMNIHAQSATQGESWQAQQQLLNLNINSTLLLTNRLAEAMQRRGQGQIVLISSLAGYFGLPVTPSYSASKAAIKAYGEGLRGWLAPHGVGVTVVMPGYVASPMCHAMPGPKPFLWKPEKAARTIARGVARNQARISFPFPLNFGSWWLAVLPASLSLWILRRLGYEH